MDSKQLIEIIRDNPNDIRKKGVSFLSLPSLFKFCDWHNETLQLEQLLDRLTAIENQGGKIKHVLPSTHDPALFRVIWTEQKRCFAFGRADKVFANPK